MPELIEETVFFQTVRLDRCGGVVEHIHGQARQGVQPLSGGVPLALVALPGGAFQMGSRHEGGYPDEGPVHPVFLPPFWIGRYPVTQAQWQAVMGKLPDCRFHGPDLPVETISWKDAAEFCARLSYQTGRRYELPSEAQWEYACRAGTITPFAFGETITTEYANYVGIHLYRDEPPGSYRHVTTPIGSLPPNPWGLHDMHGGVWEFCADRWQDSYEGAPIDGSPRLSGYHPGETHWYAARGGSWHEPPVNCRSAVRLRVEENDRMEYYGLRVMTWP